MDFVDFKENFRTLNKEVIEKGGKKYTLLHNHPLEFKMTFEKKEKLNFNEKEDQVGEGNWVVLNNKRKLDCKAFGIVLYMDQEEYEKNENAHFPFINEENGNYKFIYINLLQAIFALFYEDLNIKDIIIGHEHGKIKKKCHLQCVVILDKETRKTLSPHFIDFFWKENEIEKKTRFLFMACIAKDLSGKRLSYYCKKEGDWFSLQKLIIPIVYKTDKEGNITDKIDIWETLSKCRVNNIPIDAVKEFCASKLGRDYWLYRKNLWENIEIEFGEHKEPFRWTPNERVFSLPQYAGIKEWFYTYCFNDKAPKRKVALCIYSKRGMGKTEFVNSLVNDTSYIQTFTGCFKEPNCKEPHLIVLDDFLPLKKDCIYSNFETFKKAISSELDSIRDCQINKKIDKAFMHLPCIILTNSTILLKQLLTEPELNTQIAFFKLDEFIGPEDCQRGDLMSVKILNNHDFFNSFVDKAKLEKEDFLLNKKRRENAPIEISNQLNSISDVLTNIFSDQKIIPKKILKKEEKTVALDQKVLKEFGFEETKNNTNLPDECLK